MPIARPSVSDYRDTAPEHRATCIEPTPRRVLLSAETRNKSSRRVRPSGCLAHQRPLINYPTNPRRIPPGARLQDSARAATRARHVRRSAADAGPLPTAKYVHIE